METSGDNMNVSRWRDELYEPLSEWDFFRQVKVEEETIVFPNGLDFDSAILYVTSKPFDTQKILHAISDS